MTTWNSLDKSANITLTNANLSANPTTTANGGVRSTTSKTTGKTYFEISETGPGGTNTGLGITSGSAALASVGPSSIGALVYASSGNIWFNGANTGISLGGLGAGTVGLAVDLVNSRLWMRLGGGNWNNSGTANPATNTGGINISAMFPTNAAFVVSTFTTTSGIVHTVNFGLTAFAQTIPGGFVAWDIVAATAQQYAVTVNAS